MMAPASLLLQQKEDEIDDLLDQVYQLKQQLVMMEAHRVQLESSIRSEVCQEMEQQMQEMEQIHHQTMQHERQLLEEKYEKKMLVWKKEVLTEWNNQRAEDEERQQYDDDNDNEEEQEEGYDDDEEEDRNESNNKTKKTSSNKQQRRKKNSTDNNNNAKNKSHHGKKSSISSRLSDVLVQDIVAQEVAVHTKELARVKEESEQKLQQYKRIVNEHEEKFAFALQAEKKAVTAMQQLEETMKESVAVLELKLQEETQRCKVNIQIFKYFKYFKYLISISYFYFMIV